jgi:type I restriction enzyme S subunit
MKKNWIEVELKQVSSKIQYGYTASSSKEEVGPRLLRITDIQDRKVNWRDVPYCEIEDEKLENYLLETGDLLFARTGATVGKSFLIRDKIPESVFASYLIRVQVNKSLLEDDYLSYFFDSPNYWVQITENQSGIGQPNVNGTKLGKLAIPIAPLPEQRAIVSRIEELFSELDHSIANLKTAQAKLEIYRQAVLKKAFEGGFTEEWRNSQIPLHSSGDLIEKLKEARIKAYENQLEEWKQIVSTWVENDVDNKKPSKPSRPRFFEAIPEDEIEVYGTLPEGWEWVRLGNVTYKIGDVDHKMPKDSKNGIPYLSTGNIKADGFLDFENAKTISEKDYLRLSLKIKPEKGDIIFPRYGTIGRNVLIKTDAQFLVSYSCAIIKTMKLVMDERFMLYYTLSPVIKKEIQRYTVQTTQANIGIASIEQFIYPLCPIEEQTLIVQEIESRLSVADKLAETIETNLKKSESLRQSILKKAFEGMLLTEAELEACRKEADWEPAEKLLERIKNEKSKIKKS